MRICQDSPPIGGTHVPGVFGEQPVMAIQIGCPVLAFAVLRLVGSLHDRCASRFRALEVFIDILHENRQALRAVAELAWAEGAVARASHHYAGRAEMELSAAGRRGIAVAVVLGESEGSGQPVDR